MEVLETLLLSVSNDVRQVFSLFSVYRRIAGVMFAGCVCYADDVVPCQSALHVMLNTTAHVFNTKKMLTSYVTMLTMVKVCGLEVVIWCTYVCHLVVGRCHYPPCKRHVTWWQRW